MPIYKPSELRSFGVRAKKSFSQNFLIDQNILEKIVIAADIQPGDNVLEIGPGPGALTEHLLKKGAFVWAIEKDEKLADALERLQTEDNRLHIFTGDVLTFSLDRLPQSEKKWKVVANLPYKITTPIIQKFITESERFSALTIMVQREVGKRMTAETNTSAYSSLTLFLSAYSTPTYCFTVKPNSFSPPPSVHSCVVHLQLHPFPFSFSEKRFFLMTRTAFGKRRKMLRSSLSELYRKEKIEKALKAINKNPLARPGELDLDAFASLFLSLESHTQ
ncbi:MAG: Ribosomal RNA small subunit methyltransferase A [Chlamydiae bacterium]|nr:Ribosomal RNA small subunit methyltransferase A [Chlamydiota bacterium]